MWQTDIVTTVRALIGDLDGTKYTDNRLLTLSVIAGLFVNQEVLDNAYEVSISALTITPTPEDSVFNLIALKSSSLVLNAEAKVLAESAIKVVDGPSSIELSSAYSSMKAAAKLADDMYEKAKLAYAMSGGGTGGSGQAVLTPYTVQYLNPGYFS